MTPSHCVTEPPYKEHRMAVHCTFLDSETIFVAFYVDAFRKEFRRFSDNAHIWLKARGCTGCGTRFSLFPRRVFVQIPRRVGESVDAHLSRECFQVAQERAENICGS